jgi:hypothetical protein
MESLLKIKTLLLGLFLWLAMIGCNFVDEDLDLTERDAAALPLMDGGNEVPVLDADPYRVDGGDSGSPLRATAGAHIWFDSSVAIRITSRWFYDTWGVDAEPPHSGSSCSILRRNTLTDAQRTALAAIVLIPIKNQCSVDGYRYLEMKVYDADGSTATYRDTGCFYLADSGASVMLPTDLARDVPLEDGEACQ